MNETRAISPAPCASGSPAQDVTEPVARGQVVPQFLKQGDERLERLAQFVGVGGGDVFPDLGRARGEPGGIDEAAAGEAEAVLAHRLADHLHQGAGGELRQMAEKREQSIVSGDADGARQGAERAGERGQLLERVAAAVVDRREQPGPVLEEIGTGVFKPALPPRRRADGRRRT